MPIWEISLTLQQEKKITFSDDVKSNKTRPMASVVFTREGIENGWYEGQCVSMINLYCYLQSLLITIIS